METMPPYTYKFVKNTTSSTSNSNSTSNKQQIGYLSKDVKVINDLIDDLSKLKTSANATGVSASADNAEMTNPLEIIDDKESSASISSSSTQTSERKSSTAADKPKLKEQVSSVSCR